MIHTTSDFSINEKTRTMTSELSTVPLENLFPNSGPAVVSRGIRVRSEKTGLIADFLFSKQEFSKGDEPELLSITLTPTHRTLKTMPHLAGWTVILYND